MRPRMASVLGIDVGGTKVAVARVEGARAEDKVEQATDLEHAGALLDGIEEAVGQVVGDGKGPEAIGVGVPSQVAFATGTALASVNIPLEGVPLREELGKRFGVPVFVDNDANCAALAEAQLVDDPPAQHLMMLTLGTGVGGGVIIDGRISRGHTGLGAELGHVIVDGQTALAASAGGFHGPARWSGTAAVAAWSGPSPKRRGWPARAPWPASSTTTAACRDARRWPPPRRGTPPRWRSSPASRAGWGWASPASSNTFEPERVVLGGGLSRAADLFLDDAKAEAERNTLPALWERVEIDLARGGADAGVIGAGVLAAQELEAPRFLPAFGLVSSHGACGHFQRRGDRGLERGPLRPLHASSGTSSSTGSAPGDAGAGAQPPRARRPGRRHRLRLRRHLAAARRPGRRRGRRDGSTRAERFIETARREAADAGPRTSPSRSPTCRRPAFPAVRLRVRAHGDDVLRQPGRRDAQRARGALGPVAGSCMVVWRQSPTTTGCTGPSRSSERFVDETPTPTSPPAAPARSRWPTPTPPAGSSWPRGSSGSACGARTCRSGSAPTWTRRSSSRWPWARPARSCAWPATTPSGCDRRSKRRCATSWPRWRPRTGCWPPRRRGSSPPASPAAFDFLVTGSDPLG